MQTISHSSSITGRLTSSGHLLSPTLRETISPYHIDMLICSDLFAWPDLYQALADTIMSLSSERTRVLMAYEERDVEKEGDFFRLLNKRFAISEVEPSLMHPSYSAKDLHIFQACFKPECIGSTAPAE
uniref:Uncharacterized protein n=1 Tax=Spongospora subterranea TaxID=70186 RepID=A0A0H5R293_9EUKA|eukprot:CRZ01999.1 hypothetical protein [Spongospora subterranea]